MSEIKDKIIFGLVCFIFGTGGGYLGNGYIQDNKISISSVAQSVLEDMIEAKHAAAMGRVDAAFKRIDRVDSRMEKRFDKLDTKLDYIIRTIKN